MRDLIVANKLAYDSGELAHQVTLDLFLHLPVRLHEQVEAASSVRLFSAQRTRGVPLFPPVDASVAVGVEARQDALDLPLQTDAADVQFRWWKTGRLPGRHVDVSIVLLARLAQYMFIGNVIVFFITDCVFIVFFFSSKVSTTSSVGHLNLHVFVDAERNGCFLRVNLPDLVAEARDVLKHGVQAFDSRNEFGHRSKLSNEDIVVVIDGVYERLGVHVRHMLVQLANRRPIG